ncbi:transcription elongation factor SPT6-like [Limulus polyphemus]|uniref:Transcription elongation factor SPT6-like n=1 Tax=Limulus polyphemus TaxID=6850 RepID=A0ABM1SLI0_LIMPO|nr:transcription elongation factor SPT6-like [Limulus polyphemus]
MADFLDSEAEESEDEELESNLKKRLVDEDDEEEEEDDEEKLRDEMKDLINDEEEDEEEEQIEDEGGGDSDDDNIRKKKRRHEDYDDNLDDEDYELLETNLGVKMPRKKKFKRLRRIEDDESDAEETQDSANREVVDEREAIANELFEGSDAEGEAAEPPVEEDDQYRDLSGSEGESDPDDFIVDDDGQPISKGKKRRHVKYTDAALQEAQDIFGGDFDFDEFEQYGDEYEEEEMEEDEYAEEDEEGETKQRPKKSTKKRQTKKSIFDVYEPSELEHGHFTDLDNEIRTTDIPERFQLRSVPVTQAEDAEIEEEAKWIYKMAFNTATISVQETADQGDGGHQPMAGRKGPTAVYKIRDALKFMRNQQFEVPFIAFYKKEYVEPDLNINDLWTVYKWDEKWCQLKTRKNNLKRLFHKMQQYQCDEVMKDPEKPLAESLRPLDDSDFDRLEEVQTTEELRDMHLNFMLYYNQDVPAMQEAFRKQKQKEADGGKEEEAQKDEDDVGDDATVKHARRKDAYAVCREAGLDGLAKKFGLTPEQFGENLRDNYQRHEVDQYPISPLEVAGEYVCRRFATAEEALKAAKFMVAMQVSRDPLVRKCTRQMFFERAKICVKPIKKGVKEIDENHPCYSYKYLKNKPVKDLEADQFLHLVIAESENLLTMKIIMDKEGGGGGAPQTYLDEIKQLYYRDEFSRNVQEWNDQRSQALELALNKFLYPSFEKELRARLVQEAKDGIVKEADMKALRRFILAKKPHVIGVAGESREALNVIADVKSVICDLVEMEQLPTISVELIDNELPTVYMNSKKAEADFRDYPALLRQAVSIARKVQDPLIEFSQLCTPDEEILCLKYHPLQDQISKEELLNCLYLEFVNRTNEVGVDVNRAISHPHTSQLVQFVCGLGPRKASHLIRTLKQTHQKLENRTHLVTVCHMGPKVFYNCAGFVKIDTVAVGESAEAYVEVLDASRVHPEAYEWARKMAVDALEYDDMSEEIDPAGALEEILENPEKLRDLDLDAFAEELERQGLGNKSITLYDIRAELNHRYKDLRTPYRPSNAEETFNMLTKETPQTFYIGKLVLAQVQGIARKKPRGEQLDQANPIRNDESGLWQCPFCRKDDFPELSEVWNHFDAGSCPGQAMGVRCRLDNGVSGFIPTKMISDKQVTNPEDRVKINMIVNCRVTRIDIERFTIDLTCRSSDLMDKNNEWRPHKDKYYDFDAEEKDRKIEEDQKKKHNRQTYIKRVIVHPSFHNISYKEAESLLAQMEQGEVIIRPSSKGADHLTVTWKVTDGINQHIDVMEEGKENAFSLGQALRINGEVSMAFSFYVRVFGEVEN